MQVDEHARMLRVMDDVHDIIASAEDIDGMLEALLHQLLSILGCDRAWLLYPCDPQATEWWVPMEQARPEWPGAFSRNLRIPMEDSVRYVFEAALASAEPVSFDSASALAVPPEITEHFSVQAQMILAVYPKTDRPWMLGIHHCREAHVYSEEEQRIFASIGRRLGDGLATLIALRDLRASEANLEQTVSQRTAELEQSNRELERFAYIASHDLQEPARMVASFTQLLARRYGDQLDDKGNQYLEQIVEAAKRMQALISDLLTLSRIDSGKTPLEPTDCAEVMAEVRTTVSETIKASGAKLVVGELPVVLADRGQLRQLLQNLTTNALKFRGDAPPQIEVSAERRGERWAISVQDNGIGIAPAQHDKIFDMFERAHDRGRYEGTGIGLAIVKRVVERHGGTISVASEPGAGATFTFTMAAADDGS